MKEETPEDRRKRLLKVVADTGFGFQIAAGQAARETGRWHARAEVPWESEEGSGFADLILMDHSAQHDQRVRLVVECKRSFDDWVFLDESNDAAEIQDVFCFWSDAQPNEKFLGGWDKVWMTIASRRTQFCAISRKGKPENRVLESAASGIVRATQAIATHLSTAGRWPKTSYAWVPVILTTAKLHVVRGCASAAQLADGSVRSVDIEESGLIRFHKSFLVAAEPVTQGRAWDQLMPAQTVLVCTESFWPHFLKNLDLELWGGTPPWERARDEWRKLHAPMIGAPPILINRDDP